MAETADGTDNVGALVHDDDSGGTETRLTILEGIKVHQLVVANILGKNGCGGATGDNGKKVVPATTDTAAVLLNQLTERNRHLLLDSDGVVDVPGDTKQLGALVTLAAKAGEPVAATAADSRGDSNGLDVGDCRGAAEETDGSRERWLKTGLARLAFERLDEGRLLTADIGTGTPVEVDIKVVARIARIFTDEAVLVSLIDGRLKDLGFVDEFASDIDVRSGRVHGSAGDETSLDQLVGILAHDFAILAGTGLAFIGIDNKISGLAILVPVLEVHERLRINWLV